MLVVIEYLINQYIIDNIDTILPPMNSIFISIIKFICSNFFMFVVNDQLTEYIGKIWLDDFYALPFQLLSIVIFNFCLILT